MEDINEMHGMSGTTGMKFQLTMPMKIEELPEGGFRAFLPYMPELIGMGFTLEEAEEDLEHRWKNRNALMDLKFREEESSDLDSDLDLDVPNVFRKEIPMALLKEVHIMFRTYKRIQEEPECKLYFQEFLNKNPDAKFYYRIQDETNNRLGEHGL